VHPLLSFQRSIGNLAVQRLLRAPDARTPRDLGAPPIVDDVLRSSGQPLEAVTRSFMEPCVNYKFGGVRIHPDDRGAEAARAVDAAAPAVGSHVVFGTGRQATGADAGRRLLAHELTHVVQQAPHVHRQPERDPEADKKKVEACLTQETELLPKVGIVEHINREVALDEILGKERQKLEAQVRADYDARTFVCEAGVGAMMALFYNRDYKNRLHVSRARESFSSHPELYSLARFDTATKTKASLEQRYHISIEAGDKAWSTEDIGLLAEALGKLTDPEIPLIGGYRFLRWTTKCNQLTAKDPKYSCELEDFSTCGLHLTDVITRDYTITMYDCYKSDPTETAKKGYHVQPGAENIVHEIGHAMEFGKTRLALENQGNAKREYERLTKQGAAATGSAKAALTAQVEAAKKALDAADKAVAGSLSPSALDQFAKLTKGKKPLTPYSAKGPTEAFAEAFMLFKVAPEKLEAANRNLFKWFKKGGFI
jgi:hypothetical protein